MQRKVIGRAAALKPNNQDPTFISFHSLCISESLFVIVVALQTDVAVGRRGGGGGLVERKSENVTYRWRQRII